MVSAPASLVANVAIGEAGRHIRAREREAHTRNPCTRVQGRPPTDDRRPPRFCTRVQKR